MSEESLQLASPDENGRGSTGWLAGRMDVSTQAIRTWHKAGMPSCGTDPTHGGPLFDLAACTAWREANRPRRLHGGKRRGSGKRPAKGAAELAPAIDRAAVEGINRETAEAVLKDLDAGVGVPEKGERLSFDGLANLSEDQIKILAWLKIETSGFTLAQMDRLESLLRAQKTQREMAKARGELHDAGECDAARTRHLTLLRTKLLGLPGKAAASVVAAAKMGPETVPVVKAALVQAVDEVMREIAADPLGLAA